MMDFPIPLVVGDHGRPLRFTIRDRFRPAPGCSLDPYNADTWAPCDLTRVVGVRVPIQPLDRSRGPYPLTATKVSPYVNGVCQMIWPPELFTTPGRYEGELSLEYVDGAVVTIYRRLRFIVKARLR
ncbi:MAG: hypothetical protein HQM00_01800 [Magnetococcales bacterium]|nr:hypothetical protein [Magnetococcales bacterium]